MGPKELQIDFFPLDNFATVYRKTQRVQPPNSNNLCGNGTDFCKSRKTTKFSQNFIDIGRVYFNNWHRYMPDRAMNGYL